ncbi:PREDICTED: transmembrane channel-like protein 3, partial [Rhagoletis zephyria]|uniref:transmembrane channel-like protein 3 n=1 Tax=Rhagoletis zephyria TaxID=28612 RepID=UPI000811679A
MSRVGSKDDESAFCFKIFTGWDYMIGNSETAYNKVASLVMSLKESILEEKERKKEKTSWKRICLLIFTNLCVLALLASSAYAVVLVVERSQEIENNKIENPSWLRANENTLVVAGISNIYPNIFDFIGSLENYHPRIALRWQLGRILVLNFLNLYTLMLSLFDKVDKKVLLFCNFCTITRFSFNLIIYLTFFQTSFPQTAELRLIKGNISLTRQQLDIVALSTTATFRVKRDGREEYADYEDSDDSTLFPPAIIYDPYEVAVNNNNNNRDEQSMEGRDRFDDSQNFADSGSTTTSPPWMSTTFTSFSGGGGGGGGSGPGGQRSSASNRSTWSTSSGVHHTSNTSGEHNRLAAPPAGSMSVTLTTQWFSSNDNGSSSSSSTRKPPKRPTTKPRTRLKAGQITTTTEMVTESLLLATEPNLGSCENVTEYQITDEDLMALNSTVKDRLRKLCWETMFGQELIKLTVMDLVVLIASTLVGDFFRALIVRYCNGCTCICWDLEKKWPGYGDFKIAENILHLVNNQGMIWLGMFFSPGLPALNTVKLCLLMYFRSWALLTCNIPHETVFKASRNNNFYFILLLFMLFLCTLPVSYAVVWLEPSWHCGPFSDYARIYKILSNYVSSKLNSTFNKVLDYLTSPGAVLPLLLLMVLFIYYLLSTVSSMKEANRELKSQLRKDKDQQKKKIQKIPMINRP